MAGEDICNNFKCSYIVRTYLIKWRKDLVVKECYTFSRNKLETS
jgi:hypothetical protein